MLTKVLCVGDVVGTPGRRAVNELLPRITSERGIHCNIVNVENAAGGSGLTENLYSKFVNSGVNLMTMGDHVYRRRDIIPILETADNIVRPANLGPHAPGRDYAIHETPNGVRVAVFSLLGRMFMRLAVDCPFRTADRVLDAIGKKADIIVVDVHAEVTSEKVALGWRLDGRVSVVFGTHTHIPTADERILQKGTAYITDLGMTGPYDSVLGRDKDKVLSSMITSIPTPFDVATDNIMLCGIEVEVDSTTGRATRIERVRLAAD
jgi:hypothetical protein